MGRSSDFDAHALRQRAAAAWSDTAAFAQHLAGRAVPFASHALVSAAAFTTTLAAAQVRCVCVCVRARRGGEPGPLHASLG